MMSSTFLKIRLNFEIRKTAHFMFIPALIALGWHTPSAGRVGIALVLVWFLDRVYSNYFRSFFVGAPTYVNLSNSVTILQLHIDARVMRAM